MLKAKKTLLLIDGHAVLHRAWHALPPLTTRDGRVISGALGFMNLFFRAIKDLSPTYVAVAFDRDGPTFRHEAYEAYKATREEKPDELYEQIPIIEELLSALDVPVFGQQGVEADDVLGTIAEKVVAGHKDVGVVIVTGDKDLLQLVTDRISVYHLRQGVSDMVMYDAPAKVKAKLGVTPEQLVDYKALRGDPSDNIPGVKGVGDKTAVQLIGEFGSIKEIYAALEKGGKKVDALRPAVRKNLEAGKSDAFQALDLCRIRTDVKLDFSLDSAKYSLPSQDSVKDVFLKYEFVKLLSHLPGGEEKKEPRPRTTGTEEPSSPKKPAKVAKRATVTVIDDAKDAPSAMQTLAKRGALAFRTYSDGTKVSPRVDMFAVCDGATTVVIGPDAVHGARAAIAEVLASSRPKICHDLKREHLIAAGNGMTIDGDVFDVMIGAYLLHSGERRSSLDAVMSYYRVPAAPEDAPETARIAAEVEALMPLGEHVREEMKAHDLTRLYDEIELPLAEVLAHMERAGIEVDVPYLKKLSTTFGKRIDKLTEDIYKAAGREFNVNSPAQLSAVLFDELGLDPSGMKRTAKSKTVSTAASELAKIRTQHAMIDLILDYRELSKLRSTYVDALPPLVDPKDGRVHADFNQTVTATGRLSSSNPNLQNIPTSDTEYGRKVRDAFVAAKGFTLVAADYSQIELRLAAHVANEKVMIDAFNKGEDIHRRTAAAMFGEEHADDRRRIAKVINFGILYGMGPNRLAENAGITVAEAREYIDTYFAMHPGIAKYMEKMRGRVHDEGNVETLFGRKRFFPNAHLMNPRELAEAERQAINMPMQGTQADMIKIAMIRIDERLAAKYGDGTDATARMIIQVHDELVFEVKDDLVEEVTALVKEGMEGVVKLKVPVLVETATGKRWGGMEKKKERKT